MAGGRGRRSRTVSVCSCARLSERHGLRKVWRGDLSWFERMMS
jgi:hypothetical protein